MPRHLPQQICQAVDALHQINSSGSVDKQPYMHALLHVSCQLRVKQLLLLAEQLLP